MGDGKVVGSRFRCSTCGESLVDLVSAGPVCAQACKRCDRLTCVDVVRQLHVRAEPTGHSK